MFILLSIINLTAALAVLAVPTYRLWYAPWQAYQQRRRATLAYKQSLAMAEIEKMEGLALAERQNHVRDLSVNLKRRLIEAAYQLGIYHTYRRETRTERRKQIQKLVVETELIGIDFVAYHLKLPHGIAPLTILNDDTQENLRILTKRPDMRIVRTDYEGLFAFIPLRGSADGIPEFFLWQSQKTNRTAMKMAPPKKPLAVVMGLASNRRIAYLDFDDDGDNPHLLTAGTTGAGKSNMMNVILCTLIENNTPADVQFILIDLKMVELSPFANIPYLWGDGDIITRPSKVASTLADLNEELERRLALFATGGVRKISLWNQNHHEARLPHLFVVFDEVAMVMLDHNLKKDVGNELARIAALGRAVGIHLLMFTQRPDRNVIDGLIKTNITNRMAFNTDAMGSMTILNNGMATGLEPVGRGIFLNRGEHTSLQTPLIYPEQIDRTIARCRAHSPRPLPPSFGELLELAVSRQTANRVELYRLVDKRCTLGEMVAILRPWRYRTDRTGPVVTHKGKKFIWHGDRAIPIDGPPPQTLEEIERYAILG